MATTAKEKAIAALYARLGVPSITGDEFNLLIERIERLQQLA